MLELEILEFGRGADLVRGELDQLVDGQVASAGVAHEDPDAEVTGASQPRKDAPGQLGFVPAVAGEDDIDLRRLVLQHVAPHDGHPAPVGAGVEFDRRRGQGIDV